MRLFAIVFGIVLFWSCQNTVQKTSVNFLQLQWEEDTCLYAKNFAVQHADSNTRILVFRNSSRKDTLAKLYSGSAIDLPNDYVLLNGQKIACLSSVYAGFLDALNAENQIAFIDEPNFIYSDRIRKKITDKSIATCGAEEQLNLELLIQTKPLVLTYQVDEKASSTQGRMKDLGIPYLICTDFTENHPLGRAEWLKLFGAIVGKAQEANALFQEIVEHYESTQYFCAYNVKTKPTVFVGGMFGGNWNVSGGKTFVGQMINHAGGHYVFENDTANNFSQEGNNLRSFENVYQRCKGADVWLNPNHYHSLAQIQQEDSRYALFAAFKNKRVYNNNKLMNDFGGNAYWEMGVVRPDIVLKDLAICLHPYFFISEKPVFYQSIE